MSSWEFILCWQIFLVCEFHKSFMYIISTSHLDMSLLEWLAKIPCWCNLMKWLPKMACQNYLETWITNDFQMICRDGLFNSFHLCLVHHISICDGLNFHVHYDGKFTSTSLSIVLYITYQNDFLSWVPKHLLGYLVNALQRIKHKRKSWKATKA